MATKVVMEALSPTMEEGTIANWLKSEGDEVSSGDTLAEVETDKAVMELVARGDGTLRKIVVGEGDTVEVGSLVAVIAGEDEDIEEILQKAGKSSKDEDGEKPEKKPDEKKEDAAPEATEPAEASATPQTEPDGKPAPMDDRRIKASPLARRMAEEQGIELSRLEGSGPGGRIIKRDIEEYEPAAAGAAPGAPMEGYEDVPLSQMRKTIARRLVQSLGPVPHFFLTTEVDMDAVWDARQRLNDLGEGPKISFNDIIIKAVASALRQHRDCNAWFQDDHVRYFNEVHISMAVAIDEGLITPVIRNAHVLSLRQIAETARDLADRARNRELKPDEYTGGTFSVSNLGMFDIEHFTAVINPPEAGILAVGSIREIPVIEDGDLVSSRRMKMTMSCDHRVIDGATGSRFLQTLKRMLENPLALVW